MSNRTPLIALSGAILAILFLTVPMTTAAGCLITEQELRARVEQATKNLQDLSMVGAVTYKNKKAMEKVDPAYTRLYEFKSANVYFKSPSKLRLDGKLGMVRFEYIINGGTKIFRAPSVRITKKEDYKDDPAKLQQPLDIGLVTPFMWENRRVEVLEDAEAQSNGEIKIRLYWPKGDMIYLAWIDAKDLWLKKFEKRDGANNLSIRAVYSDPKNVDGVVWMPTKVDVFSRDGEKAGTSEFSNIKVNVGLSESLFE